MKVSLGKYCISMIKSIFEILFSIIVLLFLWPIILFSSLLIFIEDFNNPFFIQKRLGKNKRIFNLIKLRTMAIDSPQLGTHEVNKKLYLKSSYLLRKLKIDELPQFINVLTGNMTIVGPRPCLPSQDKLIKERDKKHVFEFTPGITGISQLKGIMMDQEDRQSTLDSLYNKIETKSLYFYLYCIVCTVYKFDRNLSLLNKIITKHTSYDEVSSSP